MLEAPSLFAAAPARPRVAPAPYLPTSRAELDALGWDECDVVIVTGDAYVDHPSFGMAVIGRVLEAHGFRVGIIAQPDWQSAEPFTVLGRPRLFFGVTAGNMDSMVNRYTSDRRIRSDDAYTPGGAADRRPDRASLVYAQRCREAFPGVPIVLGGIEASLRRVAHYDHWSEKVRRSIAFDARADLLLYGNAERAVVEVAHRAAAGESLDTMTDVRGSAFPVKHILPGFVEVDAADRNAARAATMAAPREKTVMRLPSFDDVRDSKVAYARASRVLHAETNPGNARALVQRHGDRELWLNPPPIPLTTAEMDWVYGLPYARQPHPQYGGAKIPAYEMIRFSVIIERGCFGGCTFCSITEHEGRIIQKRSRESIVAEIEEIRDTVPGFTGVISDLGGPTANMYGLECKDPEIEAACRRPSCVFPEVCSNLKTDHGELIELYRAARAVPGIKRVNVASGVRYDLANEDPRYIDELVTHHVGGYLKVAPEHVAEGPLAAMMKPRVAAYDRFAELFAQASARAGKKQYLIPYFIAAHPGTTDADMLELALWLKERGMKVDQVQNFLPAPMATATAMYHTKKNPLRKVTDESPELAVPTGGRQRRLHKALLRYHDPENWDLIREALVELGRSDLIGSGPECLVPSASRGGASGGGRRQGGNARASSGPSGPRSAPSPGGHPHRGRPTPPGPGPRRGRG